MGRSNAELRSRSERSWRAAPAGLERTHGGGLAHSVTPGLGRARPGAGPLGRAGARVRAGAASGRLGGPSASWYPEPGFAPPGSGAAPSSAPLEPAPPPTPRAWLADPSGRHELRYWDGTRFTEHVADAGKITIDPL